MYTFRTVSVKPKLPEQIGRLKELAYNFWFSWNAPCRALFRTINDALWDEVNHNPVKFLMQVNEEDLEKAVADDAYMKHYHKVLKAFDRYIDVYKRQGYQGGLEALCRSFGVNV